MKLIEKTLTEGAYGHICERIIIDHSKRGRLLLCEGFGGSGIEGATYRYRHGLVIQLAPNTTFAELSAMVDESRPELGTELQAAEQGYSPEYPILQMPGRVIERMADAERKQVRELASV